MGPLVPIVVLLVGGTAYKVHKDKKAKLTPKRKMILETAMNSKLTPDQLKGLADAFDKEGLKVEADLLRKRIDLQTATQEQKDKWAAAFKKAMDSENIGAITAVANAFEDKGATGAAANLRKRADDLKTGKIALTAKVPAFVPPPAAVAAVSPPTAPTVGPQSDLTSSMNQGQTPALHPLDQPHPEVPLTQTGAPGGASGLGETTVLPTSTATLNTPAAITASMPGAGSVPVVGSGVVLPAGAPAVSGSVGSPPFGGSQANPTSMGAMHTDATSTVGHPSDPSSSMNQQ